MLSLTTLFDYVLCPLVGLFLTLLVYGKIRPPSLPWPSLLAYHCVPAVNPGLDWKVMLGSCGGLQC